MKLPEMKPVKSSNIDKLGYDDAGGLFVRFHGGNLYRYPDAPRELFERAMESDSVGKFFSTEIRGQYRHQKLDA